MKKYELTDEIIVKYGSTLHRIKALKDFGNVKTGELGGYIESGSNLSQEGNCWVCGNAKVCGDAKVCGNAWVFGNAEVYGNAKVYGNAWVYGNAEVCGNAKVCGDADYIIIKGLGSKYRNTTIFRTKENIAVKCGCFYGTLAEFVDKVKETHGNSKFTKEYLALIDLVKIHFELEE